MADRSHAQFQDGRRPPERVPKSERILNLIAVLLRADQPVPVTEILGKVTGYDDNASRESLMRRFERDKKVLRDIGIPIEHASQGAFGTEGYSISRSDYFLNELQLPPESGQILRALYAWAHADGGRLSTDLRSALVKLGFLVDSSHSPPPKATEALAPRAEGVPAPGPIVGSNLEKVSEAVLRRKRVKIRYYSLRRDEEREREVEPFGLGFSGQAWGMGAWYMVGRDPVADALRVFRLSRIRAEVEFSNPGEDVDYEIPPGFRVREHLGRTRWEYQDLASAFSGAAEDPFVAKISFPSAQAPEVRSLVPAAKSAGTEGDRETLEFSVHNRRAFLRFLLRFVPRIEVLEPAGLDAELRTLAGEILAIYGETS